MDTHTSLDSWFNGSLVSDYNFNGQGKPIFRNFFDNFIQSHFLAGEDFDRDLLLPNIDFGTYVRFISFIS